MSTYAVAWRGHVLRSRLRALAVVAALLGAVSGARAELIDSFSAVEGGNPDAVQMVGVGFGTPVGFTITPTVTDPVGSRRRLTVDQFVTEQSASLTIDGSSGTALLSSSSNAASAWIIAYGIGGSGLHFNATAGGATAFRITFSQVDSSLEFVVGAYGYTGTGTSNLGVPVSVGSVIELPFADFSNAGSINFADLNQIDIRVRNKGLTRGGQVAITQFETVGPASVPEPGALLLAGLGAVGWLCAARKRSAASRSRLAGS